MSNNEFIDFQENIMSLLGAENMARHLRSSGKRIWITLSLPPILFLIMIVLVSIYYGTATGASGTAVNAAAISEKVSQSAPVLLLIVQILLLLLVWRSLRAGGRRDFCRAVCLAGHHHCGLCRAFGAEPDRVFVHLVVASDINLA
jgi:hypothetical protein